jgi:DNA-binding MarR family transcriptional regulator
VADSVDRLIQEHGWANHPNLDLEVEGIVNRIHFLAKYLKSSFDDTAQEVGINKGELDVLKMLRFGDVQQRLSPSQLSDRLRISTGAMTNRLDRLEEQGLIRRTPDPADRRGIQIELTEQGEKVFTAAIDRQIEKEKALIGPLDAKERERLGGLLRTLMVEVESTTGFRWKH